MKPLDMNPFYDALRRSRLSQSDQGGFNALQGVTTRDGLITVSRARLRAIIAETVKKEAAASAWPDRQSRRRWERQETVRRYRQAVNPSAQTLISGSKNTGGSS